MNDGQEWGRHRQFREADDTVIVEEGYIWGNQRKTIIKIWMARIPFKPNRDFKQRQKEEYLEDDKWSLLFIQ